MNMFNNSFNKETKIVPKNTTYEYKRKTPDEIKQEREMNKTQEMFNKVNEFSNDKKLNNVHNNQQLNNFAKLNTQGFNTLKNSFNNKFK